MDRVERTYYPDGWLKEEIHYRDSREHGPWRRWHPNGQLAEEHWFENGLYGTSISRTWDENGTLRSESPTVNGEQIGRATVYNEDGSVLVRKYFLENGEVSREEYDTACAARPELHRYAGDPMMQRKGTPSKGQGSSKSIVRVSDATIDLSALEECERVFVESMLGEKHAEALTWLEESRSSAARKLGEMSTTMSREFVEKLYAIGAVRILAVQIATSAFDNTESTNHLLLELPRDRCARARLFDFEHDYAVARGFDGEVDRRQMFLYLALG